MTTTERAASRRRTLCFAVLHAPPNLDDPEQYLRSFPIHREIPRALAGRGYTVHVVQHFPVDRELLDHGVHYHFVSPYRVVEHVARALVTVRSHTTSKAALRAALRIRSLQPDLIHVHGSSLYIGHFLMLVATGSRRPPIVVQYHGGFPSMNPLARRLQRFNLRRADRLLFTTHSHAEPFLDTGLIYDPNLIVEFMETSSTFKMMSRECARRQTGMDGDPVFLWTARLNAIKDPLTALRGFEIILEQRPGAQLYLHYLTNEMLPDVRSFIGARPQLRQHVHFRGRIPLEQMELVYNSADFLLQASRREFSGCAVLEAMACGVIPVVTDIPSFRAMTENGRHGVLFPVGEADALARGALSVPIDEIPARSKKVHARFDSGLSFPVLADRLDAVYLDLFKAAELRV